MPPLDCELVGDFALSPSGDHVLVGSATGALVYRSVMVRDSDLSKNKKMLTYSITLNL